MRTCPENCNACKSFKPTHYKISDWEFLKRDINRLIRWDETIVTLIVLAICLIVWGWWGILGYVLFVEGVWFSQMGIVEPKPYPKPPIVQKECPLHKDCKFKRTYK